MHIICRLCTLCWKTARPLIKKTKMSFTRWKFKRWPSTIWFTWCSLFQTITTKNTSSKTSVFTESWIIYWECLHWSKFRKILKVCMNVATSEQGLANSWIKLWRTHFNNCALKWFPLPNDTNKTFCWARSETSSVIFTKPSWTSQLTVSSIKLQCQATMKITWNLWFRATATVVCLSCDFVSYQLF